MYYFLSQNEDKIMPNSSMVLFLLYVGIHLKVLAMAFVSSEKSLKLVKDLQRNSYMTIEAFYCDVTSTLRSNQSRCWGRKQNVTFLKVLKYLWSYL